MQKHVYLRAYIDWFLRPLDIACMVVGLLYLYHRAWLLGLFLCVGNLFALIGQSLLKEQSIRELRRPKLLGWTQFSEGVQQILEQSEAVVFGKTIVKACAAITVTVGWMEIHNGVRLYLALLIGIFTSVGLHAVFLLFFGLIAFQVVKKARLAKQVRSAQSEHIDFRTSEVTNKTSSQTAPEVKDDDIPF
jgi:hypothetical protein